VDQPLRDLYAARAVGVIALGDSPVVRAAVAEGSIVLGTPQSSLKSRRVPGLSISQQPAPKGSCCSPPAGVGMP
jgi:hypothetical protein